jgi:hypothetical protein
VDRFDGVREAVTSHIGGVATSCTAAVVVVTSADITAGGAGVYGWGSRFVSPGPLLVRSGPGWWDDSVDKSQAAPPTTAAMPTTAPKRFAFNEDNRIMAFLRSLMRVHCSGPIATPLYACTIV